MQTNLKRITVIIVPGAERRTVSLHFSTGWLFMGILLLGVVLLLSLAIAHQNLGLRKELTDVSKLKDINQQQQLQLSEMMEKVRHTQERLETLIVLEQQIRALTGEKDPLETLPAPSIPQGPLGRGGPSGADHLANAVEALPILSSILPPGARLLLYAPYEQDRAEASNTVSFETADEALEHARITHRTIDEQLQELDQAAKLLQRGKVDLEEHLKYLNHRPTGLPVAGGVITDRFGWRVSPFGWGRQFHDGVDFAQKHGTPVTATASGEVQFAGWKGGGYGNTVIIEHGYGFATSYSHLVDWDVKKGQKVKRGDRIGWVGSSGASTGPHLHYEVHVHGVPVNPAKYLLQ